MNWFLAKLIYEVRFEDSDKCAQFDEQLRLVLADSWGSAIVKAREIGLQVEKESCLLNVIRMRWTFLNVSGLIHINEAVDGVELYGKLHEANDPEAFRKEIHRKAGVLIGHLIIRNMDQEIDD
jgi:hypothetical protein